jgi:carbonic anhydrase/acetyltransferase-like protein (isoleucine patch superfamily)
MASPTILPFRGKRPRIAANAFVAPTATIIGEVEIEDGASIWFGVVIRADVGPIRIGKGSNVQDNSVLHVGDDPAGTRIGDDVLIGHLAMIHGCEIQSGSFIGMSATVLDGAVIETGALVAAGSLVAPGKRIGAGWLWAGRPAKPMRKLGPTELRMIENGPRHYRTIADTYAAETAAV